MGVVQRAAAAGVHRVVLLSSQAVGSRPDSISHTPLHALEVAVRERAPEWVILRPGGFASNSLAWAQTIVEQSTVYAPYADVALPVVDPQDIAEVAAAGLTDPSHAGQTYELTGPVATTPRERTEAIGAAIGRPVKLVELTPDEAREQMQEFMPAPVADGTLAILGQPTDAETAVSPDVEKVLGRPARTFSAWAQANRTAFRRL
jgi:uncharacterized protein YbjT (DUF2867 family)